MSVENIINPAEMFEDVIPKMYRSKMLIICYSYALYTQNELAHSRHLAFPTRVLLYLHKHFTIKHILYTGPGLIKMIKTRPGGTIVQEVEFSGFPLYLVNSWSQLSSLSLCEHPSLINWIKILSAFRHNSLQMKLSSRKRLFKPSAQCSKLASKANSVLGQLTRGCTWRDQESMTRLYRVYVRPHLHLEYAQASWNPWTQADIRTLEAVQQRFTKQVSGIGSLPYEERLKRLCLTTLEG